MLDLKYLLAEDRNGRAKHPPSQGKVVADSCGLLMDRISLEVHSTIVQASYSTQEETDPTHGCQVNNSRVSFNQVCQGRVGSTPSFSPVFSRVAGHHIGVAHPD